MAGLVEGVLGDLGLDVAPTILRIAERWPDLVGPEAAAHSSPCRIRGATLDVDADSPVWVQTLRLRSPQILARLADLLGPQAPRELWVRIGRSGSDDEAPRGRGSQREPERL
jgi:predicted nucleic acid-binding Zn ribbon protein